MKKLLATVVLAASAAAVVPCPVATAAPPAMTGFHLKTEEIVMGPYEFEHVAREEAEHLRDRGFFTEVIFRDGAWRIRAWRYV